MYPIDRESPGITPLITAFRHEGLTFVVLPYIQFDHFDVGHTDFEQHDDVLIVYINTGLLQKHDS